MRSECLIIHFLSIFQYHNLATGIGTFLNSFFRNLIDTGQQTRVHSILIGHKVEWCLRSNNLPRTCGKQIADTCRETSVGRCISIKYFGCPALHIIYRRMCQYYGVRSRHCPAYLQHLFTGNKKQINRRHIVSKLGKEWLVGCQTMFRDADKNTFILRQ